MYRELAYRHVLWLLMVLSTQVLVDAQCDQGYPLDQSDKTANYTIHAILDAEAKLAQCHQTLTWTNHSPDTIRTLRFYMYMNAFEGTHSTFLRGSNAAVFGQRLDERTEEEWGYIEVTSFSVPDVGRDLSRQYIQPNDGNEHDKTVLEVTLDTPILPGHTAQYAVDFTVKLPRTIVRSDYDPNDFFLFVHWFPQIGVYELDREGRWGWNCHQFFRQTEFYADFGDYKVTLDVPEHLVIGASGCRISTQVASGRKVVHFEAYDVIDFGWAAYPTYERSTFRHGDTDIEILTPPEHCAFVERYRDAIILSLDYMEEHVGPYAYPKITVVDPPVHTLNSGFMEYPMMVTVASFYGIPSSVRSVESLVIHEFVHQYFMATLASNEKEEAWLDEGFVTYYEDRILDSKYGERKAFFNILGFSSGNAENTRLEYTGLDRPDYGVIAKPGWEFKGAFKGLIYAKTASMLRTLEHIVGTSAMDSIMRRYYAGHKFSHPREEDFRAIVRETLADLEVSYPYDFDVDHYFDQVLHTSGTIDYAIDRIENERIVIRKDGALEIPTSLEITYEDGTVDRRFLDGKSPEYIINTNTSDITQVAVDPQRYIVLDLNLNNNGITLQSNQNVLLKYSGKAASWMQAILDFSTVLF